MHPLPCAVGSSQNARPRSELFDASLDVAGASVTKSVGGYQLEGSGVHLFERVEGDHSTILGLPMLPLLAFHADAGAVEA